MDQLSTDSTAPTLSPEIATTGAAAEGSAANDSRRPRPAEKSSEAPSRGDASPLGGAQNLENCLLADHPAGSPTLSSDDPDDSDDSDPGADYRYDPFKIHDPEKPIRDCEGNLHAGVSHSVDHKRVGFFREWLTTGSVPQSCVRIRNKAKVMRQELFDEVTRVHGSVSLEHEVVIDYAVNCEIARRMFWQAVAQARARGIKVEKGDGPNGVKPKFEVPVLAIEARLPFVEQAMVYLHRRQQAIEKLDLSGKVASKSKTIWDQLED